MILNEVKRDLEILDNQDSYKMNISKDVESHVIKILTELSYKDKLGSIVRESISNAVDSHVEAGVTEPVIVSLKRDNLNNWELGFTDVGLGLDHVSFDKYIMGIGESTKRDNPNVIGGFGGGAKCALSYVDSYEYVCRKDGVERKYLIYKGERVPDRMLIYEKETEERNGVKVSLKIKSGDIYDLKKKITQQCAYFANVYYDIENFNNNYKIYTSEHFQYTDYYISDEMHISLKGVTYPISWDTLGISRLYIPLALKFENYEGIKPIFNREEIEWNKESVQAVKDKIKIVADYFVNKYNEGIKESDSLYQSWDDIDKSHKCVELEGRKFEISDLLQHSNVSAKEVVLKNVKYLKPTFLKGKYNKLVEDLYLVGKIDYGGRMTVKHLWNTTDFINKKPILINSNLSGFFRDYVKSLRYKYIVKKHSAKYDLSYYKQILGLQDYPKNQWREVIKEWLQVKEQFLKELVFDGTDLHLSQEFLDYKERNKASQISSGQGHKVLDKQEGEVTIGFVVPKDVGKGLKIEKDTYKIKDLHKLKYDVLVFETGEEELCKELGSVFYNFNQRLRFAVIGKRELSKITSKKFYMYAKVKETPSSLRLFRNIATAHLFKKVLLNYEAITMNATDLVKEYLESLHNSVQALKVYTNKYKIEVDNTIINKALEDNDFDFSLWKEFKEVEKATTELNFLGFYQKPPNWRTFEMGEFTKFINEELLMRKLHNPSNFENLQICLVEPKIESVEIKEEF